jgi:mannose-6-phosphate isomerase-like protein (cupin superfamily)
MAEKVNIAQEFARLDENWAPKIAAELNGQFVKLVKFEGEYVWHQHEHEDELFLVTEGEIEIQFRDRVVALREGEFLVVPRGVEHKPVAKRQASVILFEPATTRNTGNVDHEYTIEPENLQRI